MSWMRGGWVLGLALVAGVARAEVVSVEVVERKAWLGGRSLGAAGPYELVRGIVRYELDPRSAEAGQVADIALAPVNARGRVEYQGPFLVLRPLDPARSNGTTLVEIPNRGGALTNSALYDAEGFTLTAPDPTEVTRPGIFERGTTLAWVAWQGRLGAGEFGLTVPTGSGQGLARADLDINAESPQQAGLSLAAGGFYCAADTDQAGARLVRKTRYDEAGTEIPAASWQFARMEGERLIPDSCSVRFAEPLPHGRYELVYRGEPAPIMGLGQQAVRDFIAHLKFADRASPLNERRQSDARTILGFGYSQSARFLRDFLYRGYNGDGRGRRMFDGLLVTAAGAGRGSFNHRYALPGQAGNAVGSSLRAVDLYPFADLPAPDLVPGEQEGQLDRARRVGVQPRIFHILSGSEYWARAGSLLHAAADGSRDLPIADDTRIYFYAGTPHSARAARRYREANSLADYPYNDNVDLFSGLNAMVENMRAWVADGREPPPSAYPTIAAGTLVDPASLAFPQLPGVRRPEAPPPVWQLDLGAEYRTHGIIAEPPRVGPRYRQLVPSVDEDGNEVGGLAGLLRRLPLGTLTAWNWTEPGFRSFGYLSGLQGSRFPFAPTRAEREAAGDPRPSLEERYGDKAAYLERAARMIDRLIEERLLTETERLVLLDRLGLYWDGQAALYAGSIGSGASPASVVAPSN